MHFQGRSRLISVGVPPVIEIDRKIGDAIVGPRRTLEVRGSPVTEAVHRNDILADRAAVAVEIMDFDLERARVVACVADLAFDQHLAAASHQASFGHLDRFRAEQGEEHVAGEA